LMDLRNTSRWFIPGRISSSVSASGGPAVTMDLNCAASRPYRHELHPSQGLPRSGLPANLSEDKLIASAVSWTFTGDVLLAERNTANSRAAARRDCAREPVRKCPAGLLEMT